MFSFRQKIFLSYLIGFLVFILLLFPISSILVRSVVINAMKSRSLELIHRIEFANNDESLVKTLKDQKPLLFFRVSVISNERRVLYDSHTKRLLGPRFSQEYIVDHPEVLEAIQKGIGYHEDYSELLEQKFAYMAVSFNFHGKNYILRTAFPYRYVTDLQKDLELGFLTFATVVMLAFSMLSWVIINHFTKPIQNIIHSLRTYQERPSSSLPIIDFPGIQNDEDFALLARTFNSLNLQIQNQIDQATHASKEKEVLLESLVEGVVAVDPQGKINFVNQSALNFFGLPRYKMVGYDFDKLGYQNCSILLSDSQLQRQMISDSLELNTKGSSVYLTMVAAPKNDGTGALLVLQDMTIEIRMLEMRKDFIANASHELKTPITIIQGFAETLAENPDLPEKLRTDSLYKIVNSCKRMTSLVLDLLALSDIENLPHSRYQTFEILPLLEKCRSNLIGIFKEADVIIQCDPLFKITADPDLMEMAFMNLFTNGAKYSNAPAKIDVVVTEESNFLHFKFSDQGFGISKEDLPRIFERFYRVDKAHSKKVGGTGLGLSLVQTIVTKHQGEITVSSTKGVGTTFLITLPTHQELS